MSLAVTHRQPVGWAVLVALLIGVLCSVLAPLEMSSFVTGKVSLTESQVLSDEEALQVEGSGKFWRNVAIGAAIGAIVIGVAVFTGGAGVVAYAAVTASTAVSVKAGVGLMLAGATATAAGMEALDGL